MSRRIGVKRRVISQSLCLFNKSTCQWSAFYLLSYNFLVISRFKSRFVKIRYSVLRNFASFYKKKHPHKKCFCKVKRHKKVLIFSNVRVHMDSASLQILLCTYRNSTNSPWCLGAAENMRDVPPAAISERIHSPSKLSCHLESKRQVVKTAASELKTL